MSTSTDENATVDKVGERRTARNSVVAGLLVLALGALVVRLALPQGRRTSPVQPGGTVAADSGSAATGGSGAAPAGGSASRAGAAAPSAAEVARAQPPSRPAPIGAKLEPVLQPPQETLAMIDPKMTDPKAVYRIVFRPYGQAFAGPDRMVIRIDKSVSTTAAKKPFEFSGRNVLVVVSARSASAINKGGRYTAELRLVTQEGLLVPEIDRVRPAAK